MSRKLMEAVEQQTDILFQNVQFVLDDLDDAQLKVMISDMPLWKHVYHVLHSLDQWIINPFKYEDPSFHEPDMNSLYHLGERTLSKKELSVYFEGIKAKTNDYLSGLSDEMLEQKPQDCPFTKLTLILGQYRHTMLHLGIIHYCIRNETGKWPKYIGTSSYVPSIGKKG